MPRERVHTGSTFEPAVGWSKDRTVQLGVGVHDGRSLFWQLTVNPTGDHDALVAFGRTLANEFPSLAPDSTETQFANAATRLLNTLDTVACDPSGSDYSGVWADLNRQQINDLIRMLRRARDQAFGRDE